MIESTTQYNHIGIGKYGSDICRMKEHQNSRTLGLESNVEPSQQHTPLIFT